MEAQLSASEREALDAMLASGRQPQGHGPQPQVPPDLPAHQRTRWLEMVEELHKDAIVVTRDPDDDGTFCRAARIRSTPDFGAWPKTMLELEWLTLHDDGDPPVTGRVRPGVVQAIEQGDEFLDLTQFGLARPLPKQDCMAVSRWFAQCADDGLKAMGPRPGTGERAC